MHALPPPNQPPHRAKNRATDAATATHCVAEPILSPNHNSYPCATSSHKSDVRHVDRSPPLPRMVLQNPYRQPTSESHLPVQRSVHADQTFRNPCLHGQSPRQTTPPTSFQTLPVS